jgi:hypothetical protein
MLARLYMSDGAAQFGHGLADRPVVKSIGGRRYWQPHFEDWF